MGKPGSVTALSTTTATRTVMGTKSPRPNIDSIVNVVEAQINMADSTRIVGVSMTLAGADPTRRGRCRPVAGPLRAVPRE